MSPSGEEGLVRVSVIEAIYLSADVGHEVTIDEVASLVASQPATGALS
jgi:hypothetical protein